MKFECSLTKGGRRCSRITRKVLKESMIESPNYSSYFKTLILKLGIILNNLIITSSTSISLYLYK